MKKKPFRLLFLFIFLMLIMNTPSISTALCRSDEAYDLDGFVLYTPWLDTSIRLIDTEGQVQKTWNSFHIRGHATYLLENGSVLRSDSAGIGLPLKFFFTGGCTGRVEMFDWEGQKIWDYRHATLKECLHNDIEPLPNGNILMLVWDQKTVFEAINAGMNLQGIGLAGVMVDKIIEVEPTYPKGGKIVWEWSMWDHLIQDINPTKENYGVVADHPELIDLNSKGKKTIVFRNTMFNFKKGDFSHLNSIDYHQELDQIMVGSRYLNEIYIIDHGTTTEEAKGHIGGRSGKGGDLLYRWGNPLNYGAGQKSDQQLYAQHDAQWIEKGYPGEDHILIFDNGWDRPDENYSSVFEIVPPTPDENGCYDLDVDGCYAPKEPVWTYTAENRTEFFSLGMSGAQRLPDGNTMVCSGEQYWVFVVTPEKEVVWEYINTIPIPGLTSNRIFKTQYYPKDYEGLKYLDTSLFIKEKTDEWMAIL